MQQKELLLQELERLASEMSFPLQSTSEDAPLFSSPEIARYLHTLRSDSKPEAAAEQLFQQIMDQRNITTTPQVRAKGAAAVDYCITKNYEEVRIALELKPLLTLDSQKINLIQKPLAEHRDQVISYLKSFEYVVLTNLSEVRIYSRTSVRGKFQAFCKLSFVDFLHALDDGQTAWDALRRLEDNSEKTDLDAVFFNDLKSWVWAFDDIEFNLEGKKLSKREAIILLINKIIFIRTAEDYYLVDYNYLKDRYYENRKFYAHRNKQKMFAQFFNQVEEFFYEHYNTDLFAEQFWQYVEKSDTNIEKFQRVFENVVGLRDLWDEARGNGLLHYNYRHINEDIFGKAYETFIAEERKDSGIFYTPRPFTEYITRQVVRNVCEPLANQILGALDKDNLNLTLAEELLQEFYTIRFADIASGSGSFVVKALRELHGYYHRFERALAWTDAVSASDLFGLPEFIQKAIDFKHRHFGDSVLLGLRVILRHLFAADYDERALETAKTNLWKEAVKITPESYKYFTLKKSHILPNLSLNFARGDSLIDLSPHDDTLIAELAQLGGDDLRLLQKIRAEYFENPYNPMLLEQAVAPKERLREIARAVLLRVYPDIAELVDERRPLFSVVEFFFCYFDQAGIPLPKPNRGFHGLLSNPPWEVIKPIAKEFADIGKFTIPKDEFDTLFKKMLEEKAGFADGWKKYRDVYDAYRMYLRRRFPYQGGGDLNYYKAFTERNIELLRENGELGILIPSGIQTDRECADLRKLLFENTVLEEISSFENRGYTMVEEGKEIAVKFFPDVDNRFKYSILFLRNQAPPEDHAFNARFYMRDPIELVEKVPIRVNSSMIQKFSPVNYSIMEFRTEKDYALCAKIRNGSDLLEQHGYVFHREFHMTDDAWLFQRDKTGKLPLYEGKMIHQFTTTFAEARYFIDETAGRAAVVKSEVSRARHAIGVPMTKNEVADLEKRFLSGELKMEYELPRLGYRAIASSTNERTLIAAVIPAKVFLGNSINYAEGISYYINENNTISQTIVPEAGIWYLSALLNSFVLNFYIRNKVSANLSMSFLQELPIPEVSADQKQAIVELAMRVQAGKDADSQSVEVLTAERARMERMIAQDVYHLALEDWVHLCSTFTFGEGESRRELDAIMQLVRENWQ